MASFPLSVIRGAFGIADHVLPGLAGRAAFAIFSRTPDPDRLSARERDVLARASGIMGEARVHRLTSGSDCIAAYEFRPSVEISRSGTVLVVHGWASRSEHMTAIIWTLREAGFRVIAVDLPGHGKSSGRRLHMANAVRALASCAEWFGPFEAVIGHSFGGAVSLNAVAGSISQVAPVHTRKLVLIAAPNSMPAFFSDFGRLLNLGPRTQTAIAEQVRVLAGQSLADYVGATQLAALDVPTLVMHAPDDREVPASDARAYAAAGPHVRVHWATGLGHRRILAGPSTLEALSRFVGGADHSARLHREHQPLLSGGSMDRPAARHAPNPPAT